MIPEIYRQQISRRAFGRGVRGIGLGLLGLELVGCSNNSPESQKPKAADQIKVLERKYGTNSLSAEQARTLIPLLTQLYTEFSGAQANSANLANSTYLIHGNLQLTPDDYKKEQERLKDAGEYSPTDIQIVKNLKGIKNLKKRLSPIRAKRRYISSNIRISLSDSGKFQ